MKWYLLLFLCLTTTGLFGQNWPEVLKSVPTDRRSGDHFGSRVSIDGDYAVVGARYQDLNTNGRWYMTNAGAVYVYKKANDGSWKFHQKLVASDRRVGDYFGYEVAVKDDQMIIGAIGDDRDKNGNFDVSGGGAAYIFKLSPSTGLWVEEQKIQCKDEKIYSYFGYSASIDGDYAIIGKYIDAFDAVGKDSLRLAGSAYIFKKDKNGFWKEQQKIVAADRDSLGAFGRDVELSGEYAVVGSYGNKTDLLGKDPFSYSGAIYIYKEINGVWTQMQKVVASDRNATDLFGFSLAMDSNYLVVGAYGEDHNVNGAGQMWSSGSAYIYTLGQNGKWSETQKITANDRSYASYFGYSVAISKRSIAIGAMGNSYDKNNQNYNRFTGAGYVFEWNNNGKFVQTSKMVAHDRDSGDKFAIVLGISGQDLISGTFNESENANNGSTLINAGSVYFFKNCRKFGEYNVIGCKNYTSPSGNQVWDKSGTYYDVVTNSNGCDSVITLNLKILIPSRDTIYPVACNLYESPSGKRYYQSGVYEDVIPNWEGCDSILTIFLTINKTTYSNHIISSCEYFEAPSGKHTWYSTGIYKDTVKNSNGCDSVLTFDLKILKPSYANYHIETCNSFRSLSNKYTWTKSGNYLDTIINKDGCDSVLFVSLDLNYADTGIVNLGNQLVSKANGAFYQWMKCAGHGQLIKMQGETNQNFFPKSNGSYALSLADNNGCRDTTMCYVIYSVGIEEPINLANLKVYPNPSNGKYTLELNQLQKESSYSIYNALGEVVNQEVPITKLSTSIEIDGKSGIYFLKVVDSKRNSAWIKLIKH